MPERYVMPWCCHQSGARTRWYVRTSSSTWGTQIPIATRDEQRQRRCHDLRTLDAVALSHGAGAYRPPGPPPLAIAPEARFGAAADDVLDLLEEAAGVRLQVVGDELSGRPLVGPQLFWLWPCLATNVHTRQAPPPPWTCVELTCEAPPAGAGLGPPCGPV